MRIYLAPTRILMALLTAALLSTACQPTLPPVSLNDLPVFPGAVEIQNDAGGTTDDEAQEWLKRDAADRSAAKGKIAHKRFRLPKNWESTELMSFYSGALSNTGWSARLGAVPARQAFTRGPQMLVLYVFADQTTGDAELLATLDQ